MRQIRLEPRQFVEALQGKASCFATNLPSDAQLLDLRLDLCNNTVVAIVRSDSFEDIAELYPIPEFKIVYEKNPRVTSQPTSNAKTEAKTATTLNVQPVQSQKTQTQPNQTAIKMEQEFTPEQRRLLNFKIEGESVVVKPKQFLKAEWEDINETVKSLGGKWVKGDLISYWEIPLP